MTGPARDEDIGALGTAEIVRLHDFISAWFRGEMPDDTFGPEFSDSLHPAFQNVQPSGAVLGKAELIDPIRAAKGANPDFRITIEEPRMIEAWPGQALITYVEFQEGAKNSAAENRRRSTVLFETGERMIWRYLQETGMP